MKAVFCSLILSLFFVSTLAAITYSAEQVNLQVNTYLRYEVLRSFNLYFGQWTLKLSGIDDYLVTNSFDTTIAVEETLWGVIGWPEETTLNQIRYLDENFTSKRNDSSNTFGFESSLLFEGSVLKKVGLDGVFEIVFGALNPSAGYEVYLNTPSAPERRTCVFLTPMASVGENVSLAYGEFRIVSNESSPEFGSRQCIIGVLNETANEGRTDYQAKWDAETGVLLEVKYTRMIWDGNGTETLLWKLKETNLFPLVSEPEEPRRLELNETYVVDPMGLSVNLTRQVTIHDIQERNSISFKIYQGYGPDNFTAFDSVTGSPLEIELEYELQYLIVRVYFPRTISNGEGYSFVLSNIYRSMIIVLGDWHQFATNYVSYGMPAYYTPLLVLPGDRVVNVEQSFVRKKLRSVLIDPHACKTGNGTIFSFETQYLTGDDEFDVVMDFRNRLVSMNIVSVNVFEMNKDQITSNITTNTDYRLRVVLKNKGDNSSTLLMSSGTYGISPIANQSVYLEEDETKVLYLNFTCSEPGKGYIDVSLNNNGSKLDIEIVEFTAFEPLMNRLLKILLFAGSPSVLAGIGSLFLVKKISMRMPKLWQHPPLPKALIPACLAAVVGVSVLYFSLSWMAPDIAKMFEQLKMLQTLYTTIIAVAVIIWVLSVLLKRKPFKKNA